MADDSIFTFAFWILGLFATLLIMVYFKLMIAKFPYWIAKIKYTVLEATKRKAK